MVRRPVADDAFASAPPPPAKSTPPRRNLAPSTRPVDFEALGGVKVNGAKRPRRNYERALREACDGARLRRARRGADDAWKDATPAELVGLYVVMHQEVYDVAPEELEQDFLAARSSAERCAKDLEGAERVAAMLFWKWAKEKKRGSRESRLGWRIMFSKSMVTDFQVARGSK